MNDLNFLVREVGRRRGVQERSLEIAEVLRGVEEGNGDRKPGCTRFGKSYGKVDHVCLLMNLSWPQIIC